MMSLDTELAWGTLGVNKYHAQYRGAREAVRRLLALHAEYGIRSTWAVVGNLFLKDKTDYEKYWVQWLGRGKVLREAVLNGDPEFWFGEDIVRNIMACATPQEIGSHTFFHTRASEATEDEFYEELAQSSRIAKEKFGLALRSLVFPKNEIGHLGALSRLGYAAFRDKDNLRPHLSSRLPAIVRKPARLIDEYGGLAARHGAPSEEGGLVKIPSSYFYPTTLPYGINIPIRRKVLKCVRTIDRAIQEGTIFHAWLHPFNVATQLDYWLSGIKEIFAYVRARMDRGEIQNLTMIEAAEAFRKATK